MHTILPCFYFIAWRFKIMAFFLLIFLVAVVPFNQLLAQKQQAKKGVLKRCGTMEALQQEMLQNPALLARIQKGQADYLQSLTNKHAQGNQLNRPLAIPGPVTIPVVVHIVLPNPWSVSDDAVQYFIDRLNEDFAGINADSTNGVGFYPLRGHSLLRFILAKRDVNGNFTTGIIRKSGTTQILTTTDQPIKKSSTSSGGSTGWDITKYYNLYVGDGTDAGLLGIAPEIGPGGPAGSSNADGVCVDYRAFADVCFSYPAFKLGRTAVHEIGHNFGLYHPFDNGCSTNDFAQLTTSRCSLPAELLAPADDIPHQNNATSGCPSTAVANGCTPSVPRMFQNFMDYTDDACYSMFSKGSVKRMEWVLENCRPGYLTTLGGQYPAGMPSLDAAINSVVSPGGSGFNTSNCTGISYPAISCPGLFIPRLRITNAGTTTLTSVTITTTINGLNAVTQTIAVNILTGKSQVIELAAQVAVPGANALKFSLSAPNGGIDANAINNDLTINFTVSPELALPYTESFQSATFPPANGSTIINPDAPDITWTRTTAAGRPGNASMRIKCFDYPPDANNKLGQRDIYRLPSIKVDALDSLVLSFNVAYQPYFGDGVTSPTKDSLRIIYSTDCGLSWKPTAYAKGGASLSTVKGATSEDFVPANSREWRTERLVINDLCSEKIKTLVIGFESINDYGNNIYVDSINVAGYKAFARNTMVASIIEPLPAICNSTSFTPKVIIANNGLDTLRSLKISYQIDNGPEAMIDWIGVMVKCDQLAFSFSAINTTTGTHVIKVYTSLPNGLDDQYTANDTLVKTFNIFAPVATPVTEGFEGNLFPSLNWGVQNVNGGTPWESSAAGASTGSKAMVINNGNVGNANNAIDYFISPIVINDGKADSVFVSFDLAYKSGPQYPGSTVFPLDTLEVLVTNDCGVTFTSVWKKFGYELQTVNDPNYTSSPSFIPSSKKQWKANRIYLSPFVGASNFQLYFVSKANKQNSIWLDNISITSQTLPARLKAQGYLVYPNPFNNIFLIHHSAVEPPTTLQSVQVFNAAGQRVWDKRYNGNADRQITIDLSKEAGGIYILKMIYTNKTIVEKIIKQ